MDGDGQWPRHVTLTLITLVFSCLSPQLLINGDIVNLTKRENDMLFAITRQKHVTLMRSRHVTKKQPRVTREKRQYQYRVIFTHRLRLLSSWYDDILVLKRPMSNISFTHHASKVRHFIEDMMPSPDSDAYAAYADDDDNASHLLKYAAIFQMPRNQSPAISPIILGILTHWAGDGDDSEHQATPSSINRKRKYNGRQYQNVLSA